MGLSSATLAGHRVTSARAFIPAWGCWHADVSIDGDVVLAGAVDLVIADLTLKGTVLSGGPQKGRSHYRIVAGAGGWGKELAKESYHTDLGVKVTTVLGDAARLAGETVDAATVALTDKLGPHYVRRAGPASRVLERVAPRAWYVGEDGVTRLGKRATRTLPGAVTHGPVNLARGTVTLAAESIAAILPGLIVDGLEAVDVLHEISPDKGLRSTIWGKQGGIGGGGTPASRRLAAAAAVLEQLDPERRFRGITEYRVVTRDGKRLNLQPVRVSTGMPDLRRVRITPGVAGCDAEPALGSHVLVGFIDSDSARPTVLAFEDAEGRGFVPDKLRLQAGGQVAGDHVMTAEATALLVYNVLVCLMAAAGGGPLLAAVLQPLLGAAVNAALAAQGAPVPGLVAQEFAANTQLPGFGTGVAPSNTSKFFRAAILAAAAGKTPNVSGDFPSIGSSAVEIG